MTAAMTTNSCSGWLWRLEADSRLQAIIDPQGLYGIPRDRVHEKPLSVLVETEELFRELALDLDKPLSEATEADLRAACQRLRRRRLGLTTPSGSFLPEGLWGSK